MLFCKNSGQQQFFILILQTHLATLHKKVTISLPGKVHNQHDYVTISSCFLVMRKISFFSYALICWHKAGQPSSPDMLHTRSIVQVGDPQDTGATTEAMGSWDVAVGGKNVSISPSVTQGDSRKSDRFPLFSLSSLPFLPQLEISLSKHLYTCTAHQMSYGKYSGVTQSSVG